ncbi:hypothetical protein V8C86DRAFT_3189751 [Haematococcus lacustris]
MEGLLVEAIQPTTLTLEQMRLLQQRCLQVVVQQKQQMQAQQMQQMQQSTLAAPSFAQQTPQPLAGRQAQVLQTQVASPETPRAAPYPPQTFATGRTTTSQFPQSQDNARTSRDDEDNEEEDGAAAGTAAGAAAGAAAAPLASVGDRVQPSADRDAVLKHTSIAMEKSNGDMQHYRSWMEELTQTWEQHEPQLDLPPKPEPLPQLPQRLGPNSSQRDQLGREEAPAEEDSDNDSHGVNVHRGLDYGLS